MFEMQLTSWRDFLLRKPDIREGEFKQVWLMQLNVFLLIQCLWIIKPVVNAHFLSSVGIEKLPSVFVLHLNEYKLVYGHYCFWIARIREKLFCIKTGCKTRGEVCEHG